ncbi:DUF2633 family protein [Nostoc sp. FACHB-888]|nr:DUF2633 family protein [Nostoc sp. FACHB-888]
MLPYLPYSSTTTVVLLPSFIIIFVLLYTQISSWQYERDGRLCYRCNAPVENNKRLY